MYTLVTFDLAVVKKASAWSIITQDSQRYKLVISCLGLFHTISSFMGAIGNKMDGSELKEIIIQAGLCAGGSISKVIKGKHYNHALRVHLLVSESMEHLLLDF